MQAICVCALTTSTQILFQLLKRQSGIKLLDDVGRDVFPTSAAADGKDEVFVGRIRRDLACDNGLLFYCVADNLRKGAALNAVQIGEILAKGV